MEPAFKSNTGLLVQVKVRLRRRRDIAETEYSGDIPTNLLEKSAKTPSILGKGNESRHEIEPLLWYTSCR